MSRAWAVAITLICLTLSAPAHAGIAMGIGRGYSIKLTLPNSPSIRLHVEEAGEGAPLLLLHGLGGSTFAWRRVAPDFARNRRVIALDLKGFGQSAKPIDGTYSAEHQAALVAAFIRKRDVRGATVLGHSFGGTVALLTALKFEDEPGRIKRLVIVDAPALPQTFPGAEGFLKTPLAGEILLAGLLPEVITRTILTFSRSVRNPPPEEDITGYARPFYEFGARHAFIETARSLVRRNAKGYRKRFRKIRLPALLVWCRRDEIVPYATGRRLARLLPKAKLKVLRRCNHMPQDERPEAFAAVVTPFL